MQNSTAVRRDHRNLARHERAEPGPTRGLRVRGVDPAHPGPSRRM